MTYSSISELKTKLDAEIVKLSLLKLNQERFGTCVPDNNEHRLDMLVGYQKMLATLLLQSSPVVSSEVTEANVSILNTNSNSYVTAIKKTTKRFLGNCVLETTTVNPTFNSIQNQIEFTTVVTYSQVPDCDNIQSDITCLDNVLQHLTSLL